MSKLGVMANGVGFETVQVQSPSGVDGQGKPTYGSQTAIKARVVREEKVVPGANGTQIRTSATLWVDVLQPSIPVEQWRLTLSDMIGIVAERMEARDLSGNLDHVRVRIARE